MEKSKRISILVDKDVRDAFEYLKSLGFNASALIRNTVKEKAAEMKAAKEGSK